MLQIVNAPMLITETNTVERCAASDVRSAVLALADPLTAISVHLATVLRYLDNDVFEPQRAVAYARLAREEARRAVELHHGIFAIENQGR